MISYDGFKTRHYPDKIQWHTFSDQELSGLAGKLPPDIIGFLENEGLSSYSGNFLWSAHPLDFHDVLYSWGLNGDQCFTFLRSAFGACVYFHNNEFFYLDPLQGRVVSLGDDPYLLLNISLILDAILTHGFFEDYFKALKPDPKILKPDEIFAFVPALSFGGSFLSSKTEVVKLREHLFFLAQLFNHQALIIP